MMKIVEGRCTLVALGLGVVVFVFRILKLLILYRWTKHPIIYPSSALNLTSCSRVSGEIILNLGRRVVKPLSSPR